MQVRGYGVEVDLPSGWEAAVRRGAASGREAGPAAAGSDVRAQSQSDTAVLHAGTFALPPDRGDYGSLAVEQMTREDVFVALLEFGPEEAGTALFDAPGLPRRLDPRRFATTQLQRSIPGQAGWQHFFTDGGRPFCLYVVLGDEDDLLVQVRRVEQMLATLRIAPARREEQP